MEDCPPPYSLYADKPNDHGSPTAPTAPSAIEIYPDLSSQFFLPTDQPYREEHTAGSTSPLANAPTNHQTNQSTGVVQINLPNNPVSTAIVPLRTKCGNFDVSITDSNDIERIPAFSKCYGELQDGVLRVATARSTIKRSGRNIALSGRYVALEKKRMVVLQGNDGMYVLRFSSDYDVWQWLNVFSQHCFVAPMMEGYCEKYCKGSKKYVEYFARLTSDGILTWFTNHNDGQKLAAIQARGEAFASPANCPDVIAVKLKVKQKEYKFRFADPRSTALWLAALQWHSHRKPYRHAPTTIKNKAK